MRLLISPWKIWAHHCIFSPSETPSAGSAFAKWKSKRVKNQNKKIQTKKALKKLRFWKEKEPCYQRWESKKFYCEIKLGLHPGHPTHLFLHQSVQWPKKKSFWIVKCRLLNVWKEKKKIMAVVSRVLVMSCKLTCFLRHFYDSKVH